MVPPHCFLARGGEALVRPLRSAQFLHGHADERKMKGKEARETKQERD